MVILEPLPQMDKQPAAGASKRRGGGRAMGRMGQGGRGKGTYLGRGWVGGWVGKRQNEGERGSCQNRCTTRSFPTPFPSSVLHQQNGWFISKESHSGSRGLPQENKIKASLPNGDLCSHYQPIGCTMRSAAAAAWVREGASYDCMYDCIKEVKIPWKRMNTATEFKHAELISTESKKLNRSEEWRYVFFSSGGISPTLSIDQTCWSGPLKSLLWGILHHLLPKRSQSNKMGSCRLQLVEQGNHRLKKFGNLCPNPTDSWIPYFISFPQLWLNNVNMQWFCSSTNTKRNSNLP